MKKIMLATIASIVFGSSILSAAPDKIEILAIATFGDEYHPHCAKKGQWDVIYRNQNTTYNPLSKQYVTNSCHTGKKVYMDVVVWGQEVNANASAGLGDDLMLYDIVKYPDYEIHRFYKDNMHLSASGNIMAFISGKYTVLSDTNKFARFPETWE